MKTLEMGLSILETVKEEKSIRLTELASRLDISKSSAHRYLSTLEEQGYVVKEDQRYFLSLRFLEFGEHARYRKQEYQRVAEMVQELSEETSEWADFLVEENDEAVYVFQSGGNRAVEVDTSIGNRVPLYATAGGKAILSQWSDERIREYADRIEFEQFTDNTTAAVGDLLDDLDTVRENGYSVNEGEFLEGIRSIGAPVLDSDGTVLGALVVSGPANRMRNEDIERELPQLLKGMVNELQVNLRYS